jgi:hypothetical protein
VPSPQVIDIEALVDGVIRNNVGVDAITLAVRARCEGQEVVFAETGQRLPAAATAETTAAQPWLWCEVEGFDQGETVRLRCTGATAGPDQSPQVLPVPSTLSPAR